ncbi:MAG: AMP-binding protein [Alphaproteobacteria bacterium]|nr:AMP-binding protein [Alphaproteobacteria bacterium]MCY4498916.1 AMP-binding protein [Rhodospirillaceae bacterium]
MTPEVGDALKRLDTFPKVLLDLVGKRPDGVAIREKDYGIWQSWIWREVAEEVRALACGLASFGLERGDKVAIVGDNRPRLYWAMLATQALGGVPVPLYQDSIADEMQYVVEHAEARFAILEDQEQVDKVLSVKERCPRLEMLVYDDPRGLRHYRESFLLSIDEIQSRGRKFHADHPDLYLREISKGRGEDLSVILYTSGTTGRPKGVMLSNDNIIVTARNANAGERIRNDEEILAYLPMAWVGDHFYSYAQALLAGYTVNCPESASTVMIDLHELGPTHFFAPPRIFENLITHVMIRMEDATWIKRKMFEFFLDVAKRSGARILEKKPVPPTDRLLYALGNVLVYGPLKDSLGFTHIRTAYTAGEAIGPDIFDFFRSLGINLKQLYGQTEASVYVTVQADDEVESDTVGKAAPGVELKVSDGGEVMYRSPGVFLGYYKNPEATKETKTGDGWVHTGDAGILGEDGQLRIIDRAKDVGRLNDGTMFAPKYIENKLKFFPNVKEAVTFGDGRDYVGAFINIDLDAVSNWAERQGLPYTSYTDLAAKDEVYSIIQDHVEQVNRDLASDSALAGSQIRRFLILHKELDADDGELTRTRKVRRQTIGERYDQLIEALYSDGDSVSVEAKVTFEDGREGFIDADLKVRNAAVTSLRATPVETAELSAAS